MLNVREVTVYNWEDALHLTIHPDQQRFIAEYSPVAAVALSKAYLRLYGLTWLPSAFYDGETMVGFVALAYHPEKPDTFWVFHFFIDAQQQGKGYGKQALQAMVERIQVQFPTCEQVRLTVNPENTRAQHLYTSAGFRPSGEIVDGELMYVLKLGE